MIQLLGILAVAMAPITASADERPLDRVLQHVPDDAALVIVVPDMEQALSGLRAFGDAVGAKDLSDLRFQRMLSKRFSKRVAGVNEGGALAMALPAGRFRPVYVMDLSDTNAWDKGIDPADPRGEPCTFRHKRQTWFAQRSGKAGIIGTEKQAVVAAVKATGGFADRFKPDAWPMLEANQALVWVDVRAWRPMLVPMLAVAEGFMEIGVKMAAPEAEGNLAMIRWLVEHARTTVAEAQVYAAGFSFGRDGFYGHDMITVEPDGKIAAYLKKVQKSDRDLLRGLPNEQGTIVFAADWSLPKGTQTLSQAMLRAMLDTQKGRECLQDEETKAGIDASMKLYRLVQGYNGMFAMTPDDDGMIVSGLYLTDKPQAVMRTLRKSLNALADTKMMSLWGPDLGMEIERARTKIASVDCDAYAFAFTTEDEQMKKLLCAMYGDAPVMFTAQHPNGVAYAIGPDSVGRETIARLLDSKASPLTENEYIVMARNAISPKPDLCLFADLPGLVKFGLSIMESTGAPVPSIRASEEPAPYLAFGIYLERESMRAEVYIPAGAVKRVMQGLEWPHVEERPVALR